MVKFSTRLRELRKRHGLSQNALAEIIGTSKSSINMYERGDREPGFETLEAFADFFNVNMDYLLGRSSNDGKIHLTQASNASFITTDVVEIRFLGEVAAGYGTIANEEYEYLKVPTDWLRGRPASDYFAMRVKGSSMYPEYRDGDEVLCLSCSTMERSGQTGVIVYGDGEATLKKLEYVYGEDWLKLVPVNPEYETKIIKGEELEHCRVIGRAIKLIRDC